MEIPFDRRYQDEEKRVDYASDTWNIVQDYLYQQERLAMNEICREGLNIEKTEHLRGRMFIVRKMLNDLGPPT